MSANSSAGHLYNMFQIPQSALTFPWLSPLLGQGFDQLQHQWLMQLSDRAQHGEAEVSGSVTLGHRTFINLWSNPPSCSWGWGWGWGLTGSECHLQLILRLERSVQYHLQSEYLSTPQHELLGLVLGCVVGSSIQLSLHIHSVNDKHC